MSTQPTPGAIMTLNEPSADQAMSEARRTVAAVALIVGILLTPLACLASMTPDPTATTINGATTP